MRRSWIDPKLAAAFAVATVTAVSIPRADAKCEDGQCGMNTAQLRQTRINAIHLGGDVNLDGVSLDVTSFRLDPWKEVLCRNLKARFSRVGPPRPFGQRPPLFLTIYEGELAAVDGSWDNPAPHERYRALCLVGARFTVRVPPRAKYPEVTVPIHLRIGRFGRLESWVDAKSEFVKADEQVSTYPIFDRGDNLGSSADDKPLCESLPPMERWQAPNDSNPDGIAGFDQSKPTDHALLYQGEAYDDSGTIVEKLAGPGWFYFACPRTALHKARLMGMNPMQQGLAQTALMRQATLKMITARYDGATPQTGVNIPLIWVLGDRVDAREVRRLYAGTNYGALTGQGDDGAAVDPTAVLEAVWGPSGALCLTEHPRVWDSKIDDSQVWFKGKMKSQYSKDAEAYHRKEPLQKVPLCADVATSPEAIWTTYSPTHDHL